MKHTLLIMRHAKSDWTADKGSDFDRPLNARGIRDAAKMGRWLKKEGYLPDVIVSSPALRAKETISRVCDELGINGKKIVWDRQVYEAHLDDLLEVIAIHANGASCMLLAGHNPGLDTLVSYLTQGELPLSTSGKLMTTAAIAVLDYGKKTVAPARAAAGLVTIARPKEV